MKKIFIVFFLILCSYNLKAQKDISPYFFNEYKQSLIIFENGKQATAPLNYDLINMKWLYIDQQDRNLIKELLSDFAYIKINDSIFIPGYKSLIQLLQLDPQIVLKYEPITRRGAKSLTYGGNTQTAAVDSYSGLRGSGLISGQNITNRYITGFRYIYEVKVNGRKKSFSNKKELAKIFKKKERNAIMEKIKKENLDFSSSENMIIFIRKYILNENPN